MWSHCGPEIPLYNIPDILFGNRMNRKRRSHSWEYSDRFALEDFRVTCKHLWTSRTGTRPATGQINLNVPLPSFAVGDYASEDRGDAS